MRATRLGLLGVGIVVAVASLGFTQQLQKAAPQRSDPVGTAGPLVNRFFSLVERHDTRGLGAFLSPAFQIERADGSGATKAQYLANLPTITSYSVSGLTATQTGSVLVVRYLATIEGVVNGKRATPGPAPRLSVFVRNASTWNLLAHANFNPLTG